MQYLKTLTIAGSDSGGGAGIQADIKTMSALGCFATSVITAVTAQNTCGVTAIHHIPPAVIRAQLAAVMDDICPSVVKIGMLGCRETIDCVADELARRSGFLTVIDPVMAATSGDMLMQEDAREAMEERLFPLATLLTPNLPEAEALCGMAIDGNETMVEAGRKLVDKGCEAVLLKGGHMQGTTKTDLLVTRCEAIRYESPAVATANTHGTGCTLSAAIASFLARGYVLGDAVKAAKDYIDRALRAGSDVVTGKGAGPVNHFFQPQPLIKRP